MKLTKTDRAIIKSYASMIDGLSTYLGSIYEISLHSLEDYDHSVVKIANGYHSGRSEGAPLTDLALNMLKRIEDDGLAATQSHISYNAVNALGERLKSSTIPIIGENDRLIGILCINLYLDSPYSEVLESINGTESAQAEEEYFAVNTADSISQAINSARLQIMTDPDISSVNKNKELIRILHNKGIFTIKNAAKQVADALGLSVNTVYLHLRSIAKETEK